MKIYLKNLVLLLCLFTYTAMAQNLSPKVSHSSGGNYVSGGVELSWSFGESFIPTLSAGGNMLSQGIIQPEVEILTQNITGSPFCNNTAVSVPFYATGIFSAANVFTAQLSDATGSFLSPTNIGTLTGSTSGTINATIPLVIAPGSQYRIRVVSSIPAYTGVKNGSNLTINLCGNNTWIGITTDWFTPANWTFGSVPNSCASDVLIPTSPLGGQFPHINGTSPQVGNITVQDNASIDIDATKKVSVCGDFTGGSATAAQITGAGIIELNGSSLQQISGKTEFETLRLDNSSDASLQAGSLLDIFTAVELKSGDLNTTAGTLRFRSTSATQIAVLDNFSAGFSGTLTGNVVAQRYYDAAGAGTYNQHLMGSPINTAALSQFGTSGTPGYVVPLGSCDETQVSSSSPYGSVFSYDETHGTTCATAGWKVEISGNAQNGKGYSIYKTGAGTLSLTGAPNVSSSYAVTGMGNANWSNTSLQGRPMLSGWHLVANPYLSNLDISSTPTGFDGTKMVWHTAGVFAGSYQAATVVQPFQAFMVHKTNPGGSISYPISGTQRTRGAASTFQKQANDHQLTLIAQNNTTQLQDVTTVAFNSSASADFDGDYDAIKAGGSLTRHTLYSYNTNPMNWLCQNTLKSIEETSTVNVGFEPGINGNYTFHFDGVSSFDPTSYITLEDKLLNVFHNVRSGDYTFTANANDNWNRFVLHFTPAAEIHTTQATCEAGGMINIEQPGPANWNYTITNVDQVTVGSGSLNNSNSVNVSAANGVYTITLVDNNGYTVVKNVLVNGATAISATITASATTAEVGEDVTFTATTANAATYLWEFGDGSNSASLATTHNYNTDGVYAVKLTVSSLSGCISNTQQMITVTAKTATGIGSLVEDKLHMWSNGNRVYVDFSALKNTNATIDIYDILGRKITGERFTKSSIYTKELNSLATGYVLVSVLTDDKTYTSKLLISNNK